MIEAVNRIGKYVEEKSGEADLLSTFIENPNSNGRYKWVLSIILKENGGVYSFDRVDLDEFKKYPMYLYKKGAPNGTDATPTSKIAGDPKTTFQNRFLKWFQNYDSYDISKEEKDILRGMNDAIRDQEGRILADLLDKFSQKGSKENAILTLVIEQGEDKRYLSEFPVFKKVLIRKGKDKYFVKKSQGESRGLNAACSICRATKDEVYGFAIPWAFHTFDKPGFIVGGFEVSDSWKNTPVCFDCATSLEVGKKWIEENLDFSFYGFRYLLVPKLVLGGDLGEVLAIFGAKDQKRKQRLTREVKNRLTADEDEILDLLKDQKDSFSNSLIFYKKEQSSYRILLHVEGILPSRLRTLFEVKAKVDERFQIYNEQILSDAQKEKVHLVFNFGVLRRFFPAESRNRTYDKIFLEIVNKIFVGNNIDYHLLMDSIMRGIRDVFIKEEYSTNVTTLNGFMLLQYIRELDLFRDGKGGIKKMGENGIGDLKMEELEELPLKERIERFFGANKAFFDGDAKKATFLEGVLAQNLLNIQWNKRKSTPFRAKLHGLKMNEGLIKRLLPEIQNKLEEYDSNYYRELEEIIAAHFVRSGINWKETDDELSFYFVLGMDMHKLFRIIKEEEENREDA